MKVLKITQINYGSYINSLKKNDNKQQEVVTTPIIQAGYKDFNINFRGRTPENFYAQEFNIKNMPETMNTYLNEDYETRKHFPPEQIMNQSFKYLEVMNNFSDVKSTYPDEKLFSGLHEANLKGRSGILSDIKIAKGMSDAALLKDGTDDFGMYLLKKIFLEGKTIKEINKDFYEKDLASEYKGVVTQPITYGTTSAYGIKYPKTDFWHSFIATRDEYKKFIVDLPKQDKADLKKELEQKFSPKKTSGTADVSGTQTQKIEKKANRKYSIKAYQKERIKKDIKDSKGDVEKIKKSIRKQFSQNDPEASFIIKYISPIMTIAADRIHLSEEMKNTADNIRNNGSKVENLFSQFWKANPSLLDYYSTTITDTIELFEETYGDGGIIPINNEYQVITDDVENKKMIDSVPQRFLELLDYVQTIVPNRMEKYTKHDELQKQWEEHFKEKYGDVKQEEIPVEKTTSTNSIEILKAEAEKNNGKVYNLKGINGEEVCIVADLDETFGDYIKKIYHDMPTAYVNTFINKSLKNKLLTEDAKLSFSTLKIADKLDDERILGLKEMDYIMNLLKSELQNEAVAASMSVVDVYAAKSDSPVKIYRNILDNCLSSDSQELSKMILKYEDDKDVKSELNRLYSLYKTPITTSETIKITNCVLDYLRNFDLGFTNSEKSVLYKEDKLAKLLYKINQVSFKDKDLMKELKNKIMQNVEKLAFSRTLLLKTNTPAQQLAKTEIIARELFASSVKSFY